MDGIFDFPEDSLIGEQALAEYGIGPGTVLLHKRLQKCIQIASNSE